MTKIIHITAPKFIFTNQHKHQLSLHNPLKKTLQEHIVMVALHKLAEQVGHYKTKLNGGHYIKKSHYS